MQVHLEPRLSESRLRLVMVPVVSVLAASVVLAVVFLFAGVSPLAVFWEILYSSFLSEFGLGDTLALATPLILASLAVAVAFKMRLLSVGAEGQLVLGAIFSAAAAILMPPAPWVVALPVALLAGMVGGALWALGPALLSAYLSVNVVITTLLLNFVAILLAMYLIFGTPSFLTENLYNFPQGKQTPTESWLPYIGNQSVTWGVFIALAAALGLWFTLRFTRFGYHLRLVGDSPRAAEYAGVSIKGMVIMVMLISGALAGLAGSVELTGRTHALDPQGIAIGIGYTAIVVAVLARLSPIAILPVAVFLAGLENAGSALQGLSGDRVPVEIVSVMIGTVLIFALVGDVFTKYRIRVTWRRSVERRQEVASHAQ